MLRKLLMGVGIVLVAFFALGTVGAVMSARDDMSYSQDPLLVLTDVRSEKLSAPYKGIEAPEGYSLYRIIYAVDNQSIYQGDTSGMYFYYSSLTDTYGDVMEPEEDRAKNTFYYSNEPVIPAGRTADVESLVAVQDCVDAILVEYYLDYSDGYTEMELTLQE